MCGCGAQAVYTHIHKMCEHAPCNIVTLCYVQLCYVLRRSVAFWRHIVDSRVYYFMWRWWQEYVRIWRIPCRSTTYHTIHALLANPSPLAGRWCEHAFEPASRLLLQRVRLYPARLPILFRPHQREVAQQSARDDYACGEEHGGSGESHRACPVFTLWCLSLSS
jgi:hypothetical protein